MFNYKAVLITSISIVSLLGLSRLYLDKQGTEDTRHICTYEWCVIKEATHYRDGEEQSICSECGNIEDTRVIPMRPHEMVGCECSCGHMASIDEDNKEVILNTGRITELNLPVSGDIIIPETIYLEEYGENFTIVGLGNSLFEGNTDITSVVLPDTIVRIGDYAFNNCKSLKSINFPEGLKHIGKASFQLCTSLEHVELPDSLETFGGFAFNHCTNFDDEVLYFGKNVKLLGDYKDAPAHMFYDFGKDDKFREFSVDKDNLNYKSLDGVLYTKSGKTLISIPRAKEFENNTYIMPDELTNLGELSFSRNQNINKILLNDNIRIDSYLNTNQSLSYLNVGNDLSIATYIYCPVQEYLVRDTNDIYKSIDGILYTKDLKKLIAVPNRYKGIIDIPEGVEEIVSDAIWVGGFYYDNRVLGDVKEVIIPSTVNKIEENQLLILNSLISDRGATVKIDGANEYYRLTSSGYIEEI